MEKNNYFITRTANDTLEYAKSIPIPRMLFSELWIEGEICILFADTNQGKSVLAVNIADSISKGIAMQGFKLDTKAQPVLYFDFEMTAKQFQNRYTINYANEYKFSSNFFRVEINYDYETPDNTDLSTIVNKAFEDEVKRTGAKVVIVDNLTWLIEDNERAKDALPFMKKLKLLKEQYQLSILVLAHTPKRDNSRELGVNDIQGSKMLANFMDSSFAIGASYLDAGVKYIKQIKTRAGEHVYNTDNVITCRLEKKYNYLQFSFVEYGYESTHIKQLSSEDKQLEINEVLRLKNEEKLSFNQIAERMGNGMYHMKAYRIYNKHNIT